MSKARIGWIALIAVLLWLPQYAEAFWMQTGLFAMSAAIGAIPSDALAGYLALGELADGKCPWPDGAGRSLERGLLRSPMSRIWAGYCLSEPRPSRP